MDDQKLLKQDSFLGVGRKLTIHSQAGLEIEPSIPIGFSERLVHPASFWNRAIHFISVRVSTSLQAGMMS